MISGAALLSNWYWSVDRDKPTPVRLPTGDQSRPHLVLRNRACGINRRHGPPGTNEGDVTSLNNFRIVKHKTRPLRFCWVTNVPTASEAHEPND